MQSFKFWVVAAALALGGCIDSDRDPSFAAGVGGTVNGLSGELTLVLNGSESLRVSSNGAFAFTTRVPAEASYSVTIGSQPANQTCAVLGGSGTMPYASINSVVVNCAARGHALGGNVSGLIGSVTLSNGADRYTTSTDGPFSFAVPVPEGAAYAVTVQSQPNGQLCSVSNGAGTMGASAIANVAVVCSTNAFVVGGTVSGLTGDVVLQNNGGDPITISDNGAFEFPTALAQGSSYAVTVLAQPATQTCSVSHGTGAVGAGDVSDVTVVCSTNTFNLGGTVAGLSGTVVLQNNGGDNLTINSGGAFTFPTPVAQGANYAVTVLTQPATQTCTVSNGTGTMGMSDVTGVGIVCAPNMTTLSTSARLTVPVGAGTGSLIIDNTGAYPALNVGVALPAGWTNVSIASSDCGSTLPPLASCTIELASSVPYVAQGAIQITADNVSSPPVTAIAFSIDDYLVFSVDSANTASVIDLAATANVAWSNSGAMLGTVSLIHGPANTAQAVGLEGPNAAAAMACYGSTAGGTPIATWYLPAVCQLTNAGGSASCPAGQPNIFDNLVKFGFGPPVGVNYWTSTEHTATEAWVVAMSGSDPTEAPQPKIWSRVTYCARSISY